MFDSFPEFIPVSAQILIFLATAWHILLVEKRSVDNLWLFFMLFSAMFPPCYLVVNYFPFLLFTFFLSFIALNIFITLFIYSYPRSKLVNYPWFFTGAVLTAVLLYLFYVRSDFRGPLYAVSGGAFAVMQGIMVLRKRKYLRDENGRFVLFFLTIAIVWGFILAVMNTFTVHFYDVTFLRSMFVSGIPLLFLLVLFYYYKRVSTQSTISLFLFITFFFFALPISVGIIYLGSLRALVLPHIMTEHFFLAATVLTFVVYNILALLILAVSTLIDNHFNKRRKQLRRVVVAYRSEISRYASHRGIIRHFTRTLVDRFREISSVEFVMIAPELFTDDVLDYVRIDRSLKASPLVGWFTGNPSYHFLLKRTLSLSPDIRSYLADKPWDLILPVLHRKEITGFIFVTGRSLDKSIADTVSAMVASTGEAFLRAGLFAEVLEKEKQLKEREHFQETGKILSFIAHELRTPLSSIIFNMDVLMESVQDNEPIDVEYLDITRSELSRLNGTIDRMLTYGRDIKLSVGQNDFMTFFRELEFVFAAGDVPVHFENDCLTVPYYFDWDRLRNVVSNLVSNSVQAITESGVPGTVTVAVQELSGIIHLSVSDSGPGIPDDVRSVIFEPFFTTRKQGNGLGLAICEKIVRLSGGRIVLRQSGPAGTTFELLLPVRESMPADDSVGS